MNDVFSVTPRHTSRLVPYLFLFLVGCFDRTTVTPVPDDHPTIPDDHFVPPDVIRDGSIDTEYEPFVTGTDIRGIAADEERLYWVEYGSFDGLGNYRYDGKLRAMPLEGGTVETLADDLAAPKRVAVTTGFAYVQLDRAVGPSGIVREAVGRVPLSGGTTEYIDHDVPLLGEMFAHGDRMYLTAAWHPAMHVGDGENALAWLATGLEGGSSVMAADDEFGYVTSHKPHGLWEVCRTPRAGGECEVISAAKSNTFVSFAAISGEVWGVVLDLNSAYDAFFARAAPNQAPVRLASLQAGAWRVSAWGATVFLTRYEWEPSDVTTFHAIRTSSPGEVTALRTVKGARTVCASRVGLFYLDGPHTSNGAPPTGSAIQLVPF